MASLIQELRLKDDMIKDLRTKLAQVTATPPTPKSLAVATPPPVDPEVAKSNQVISELKSQMVNLENENARLKSDLQDR